MPSDVLLIAQVDPEVLQDIEISAGAVVSGLLVLSALVASLVMMTVWANRISQGQPVLPAAGRKPLCVPVLLLVCGLALTMTMATIVATTPASEMTQDGDSPAESVEEGPVQKGSEVSAENAGAVVVVEDSHDVSSASTSSDVLQKMLVDTMMMNLTMFVIFGTAVYLAQQGRSRLQKLPHDPAGSAEHQAATMRSVFPYGDLDAAPEELLTSSSVSIAPPYASVAAIDTSADPAGALSATVGGSSPPELPQESERWELSRELRFAFETFLVAYLPTAAVRILMVSLLPQSPSHPFLEMINEGVEWRTMSLIALMAVIVAPLVEELLYRVTILGGMMQQGWLVPGWIVSSLLFGFAHGFPDSIALLPLAFAIGYVYLRRRSYRTVMLVHLLFNGFNMVIAGTSLM
ncbi:MAG: CPBP family intramembrane metalloprotease [Fuerstiella sp.]|nr:CPBP family intramembrane metalloprotease [Fuerstiella sp.]MCP4506411.1 CPBP family intramembrane metalloprotease [Fuerstiella sp.]